MNKENNNQEESKFMQLWHNKRTHAAMVLGLWMIFLLFVVIISFVGGEATQNEPINNNLQEETEEVVFEDYDKMQKELLKNNFEYEYIINNVDSKIIYKGEKLGVLETGYRETSEETIKYYVDESGLYKVVMDELDALDKLYENVVESYIDLEYIFNEINTKSRLEEVLENTRTYTYKYVVEGVNYEVVVTTDLKSIKNIDIKFEDKHYELKFSNINGIESLSFVPKEVN